MGRRRIAVAGFQHETNTFAPGSAGIAEFLMPDSWPGMLSGEDAVSGTLGMNIPLAGAVEELRRRGEAEVVPILWCAAEPSGPVTDEAFDWVCGRILDGLDAAGPLDAVYLDLHGAMVTESHDDGEAELLRRIRRRAGRGPLVGISLDLHANLSAEMVEAADLITVYRTYPHLDMAGTGARCAAALLDALRGAKRFPAFRQGSYLIPLHAQSTCHEPCRSLYRALEDPLPGPFEYADLALGFTASDIPDCGPAVVAYGDDPESAAELADRVLDLLETSEADFDTTLLDARSAVRRALDIRGAGPVVIADVQDNPGAGGTADTTGLLRSLIDMGAENALLGVIHDPETAAMARDAGVGAVLATAVGGGSGSPGQSPVTGEFRVLAVSDGDIPYAGAMYGGGVASLGPSCLLGVGPPDSDIRIVVSSTRIQCLDRALFTHFGADPASADIVCVKSTVHFRADFEPMARAVLNAASPGAFSCRLLEVPYRKLRNGVRLGPLGPEHNLPPARRAPSGEE